MKVTAEMNMISKQAHTQDLHIGVSHTNRSNRDLCSKMQVSHVKIIACSMLQVPEPKHARLGCI